VGPGAAGAPDATDDAAAFVLASAAALADADEVLGY